MPIAPLLPQPTIYPIPRFSGNSASLDYANRWRGQHTESAYHGDRKSSSTRLEISTPSRRYGCTNIADIVTPFAKEMGITFRPAIGIAYVTTIRNRHSETVDRALVSWNSVRGRNYAAERRRYLFARRSKPPARPQFRIGSSTRSAQGRIRRFPVRRPKCSPGVWSQAADVIAYGHPFGQTSITFRSIIRIAYKTPIRNRHSEAPVDPLLPQNRHSEAPVAPLLPQAIRRRFGVEKPSVCTPKLRFQLTISVIPSERTGHNFSPRASESLM
ncbi:hypothetical protein Taro_031762 [Colocasia esculenta]|uniref:Uncharacterized protein n=1 Tax=Colocasia esculenta TaxID=4460 RepID=A0A843VQW1_COLES|nr:hypothetical protein [Colocasia esculenta]